VEKRNLFKEQRLSSKQLPLFLLNIAVPLSFGKGNSDIQEK